MLVLLFVCAFVASGDPNCGPVADFATIDQCQDAREDFLQMKLIDRAYCQIEYDDDISQESRFDPFL